MNPLEKILTWLNELPFDIQSELISLSAHFHFDRTIESEMDENGRISKFKEYLTSDNLDEVEIVQRTLFIKKLFDFSLVGRATEQDWTEAMDKHIEVRTKLKEEGFPTTMNDRFLSSLSRRKQDWIDLFSNWNYFKKNEISDKEIEDWYFFQSFKK